MIARTPLLLLLMLCFPVFIFAETIVLKSGKELEGKIIKKTDEYIKIDFYGVTLTYFLDEIESINGDKIVKPLLQDNSRKKPYERQGDRYYYSGDLDQAIFYYKKAIDDSPEKVLLYDKLGDVYLDKGLFNEAVVVLEKGIRIQPEPSLSLINAYNLQGNFLKAKECTDNLIKSCKNKEDPVSMSILGILENIYLPQINQLLRAKPTEKQLKEIRDKWLSSDKRTEARIIANQKGAQASLKFIMIACQMHEPYPNDLESIIETGDLGKDVFDISEYPPLANGYVFIYKKDDNNCYVGAEPFVYGKSGNLYLAISNESNDVVIDENRNNRPDPGEPVFNP